MTNAEKMVEVLSQIFPTWTNKEDLKDHAKEILCIAMKYDGKLCNSNCDDCRVTDFMNKEYKES